MSTSTLIFGGSGKVARHLTRLLAAEQNHTVHSIIRKEEQKPSIQALGGTPIVQSIEDSTVEDMAATMTATKATTIVFSAGAGGGNPDRTRAVDRDGAIRTMDAAAKAGVKRYIMVSAVDVRDREKAEPEWYDDADRARNERTWGAIGTYMEAKFAADRDLVVENGRRGLEWTIVRPTRLSAEPAKGTIAAGKVHLSEREISREDVAAVVVECMRQDATKGLAVDCVGGDVPIADAIATAARERADAFEGRY